MRHLGDFDRRGRSREARLAGLEHADWTKVSPSKAVDASNSKPVGLTWSQLLLLSALVVLRARNLLLENSRAQSHNMWRRQLINLYASNKWKFYLFIIQGPSVYGCSSVVVVSRQKVVVDLWEEWFEHGNVKPSGFVGILQDTEVRV